MAHYVEVAGIDVAARFVQAFEHALDHIGRHPGTGSRRYVHLLEGAELRFWTFSGFPYSVFFIERNTRVEIVRVLHQASDIPSHLDH